MQESRARWRCGAVSLVSVALVFAVQFGLSGWAEETSLNHELQHGMFFACGIALGWAIGDLLRRARQAPGS